MALLLELTTPGGVILEVPVDSVEVPLRSGVVTLLCGHLPMAGLVDSGILAYFANGKQKSVAIDSGFLHLQNDHVTIMVDQAIHVVDIDPMEAENARKCAEIALENAKKEALDGEEIAKLEAKVRYQITKQQCVKH
ncbi:MAG: ATP synthase F1 subunit epsilon [Puniceicoccales bacterium]|jgi:F-type H+-transporting ATPase subunit epsilon|nr:ATP synthase F1 subunit epsilon [Puniceicoccales bacterium]